MNISARVQQILPSATLAITAKAQAMRQAGLDVVLMSAGEPDFPTPENICEAARAATTGGNTKYTPVAGATALRQAIVQYAKQHYGIDITMQQTIVGTGGKQVLFNAIAALLDPGDEVILASPYWVSYPDMIRYASGVPVMLTGDAQRGYLPQADLLAQYITSKTRILLLNSPSNPTGAVYHAHELEAIATLMRNNPHVNIISDDIYSGLVYDATFVSIAHVAPDLLPRTLIATGVSKSYAMTGWRIGFGIGPNWLINAMADLQGATTSGACSIAQAAATEALLGQQTTVHHMRDVFKNRRDRIVHHLQNVPNITYHIPQGAFYVFVCISAYLNKNMPTSDALCDYLLQQHMLALVPGAAFGSDTHVRLSFACSEANIDEGIRRLQAGLQAISAIHHCT